MRTAFEILIGLWIVLLLYLTPWKGAWKMPHVLIYIAIGIVLILLQEWLVLAILATVVMVSR